MPRTVVDRDQAAAWDGEEGERWTVWDAHYNASVSRHTARLFEAAQVGPADRVVDVGCGCGETTRQAARLAPSGAALGLDLSARMIGRARELSTRDGVINARFEQADAQVYPLEPDAYDLVISRFGAMFFGDPVAAFTNLRRGLRPGGRLALVAWQPLDRNAWLLALREALAAGRVLPAPPVGVPGPFGLADPNATRTILTDAGFAAVETAEIREPFWLGADAADAFQFARTLGLTEGLLADLDEAGRQRALDALRATLVAHDTGQGVLFDSRAWLIAARRP